MAAGSVLGFWAVCTLLIIVPGADWAFVISAGLGGRSVIPAVGGLVLGYTGLTVVVAAGVGALVARTPALLTALTVVGGSYLMWRGAVTLAAIGHRSQTTPATPFTGSILVRGVGVSGLNPKGLLLFLALLPQFADRHASWPIPAQLGLLGVVFTVTCGTFYLGLGSFVRKILNPGPGRRGPSPAAPAPR